MYVKSNLLPSSHRRSNSCLYQKRPVLVVWKIVAASEFEYHPSMGLLSSIEKIRPFGRMLASSGEKIRTSDLRVMRDFPGFGTFFTQAPHFSLA